MLNLPSGIVAYTDDAETMNSFRVLYKDSADHGYVSGYDPDVHDWVVFEKEISDGKVLMKGLLPGTYKTPLNALEYMISGKNAVTEKSVDKKTSLEKKEERIPIKAGLVFDALIAAYIICVAVTEGISLVIIFVLGAVCLIMSGRMEAEIAENHPTVQTIKLLDIIAIGSLICSMFTSGVDSGFFEFWVLVTIAANILNMIYVYRQLLEDGAEEKAAERLCCITFAKAFGYGTIAGLLLAMILYPVVNKKTKKRRIRR